MWGRTSRTSSQGRKWYRTSPAPQERLSWQWVPGSLYCCHLLLHKSGNGSEKCHLHLLVRPQRTLNSNNAYEEGTIYRSCIGESTVSLDSTLRSAKSRNSYLAYALRYPKLADYMAATNILLHGVCLLHSFHVLVSVHGSALTHLTHSCTDGPVIGHRWWTSWFLAFFPHTWCCFNVTKSVGMNAELC